MNSVLIYFLAFFSAHFALAQQIKNIDIVVNDITNLSDVYFNEPQKIISLNNNFYVLDNSRDIYKYDKNWKLVNKIGRKGKGPGEFLDISLFNSINDGIAIFDRGQRKFCLIENKTTTIKELYFEKQYLLEAYEIFNINDGYLIYNLNVGGFNNSTLQYAEKNGEKIYNIASISEMMDLSDKFSYRLFNKPRICINELTKDKTFMISPYIYNNCIVLLKKIDKKWEWRKIEGKKLKNPFERRDLSDLDKLKNENKTFVLMSSKNEKYLVVLNSICNGLFYYKNKYLFQFVTIFNGNRSMTNFINVYSVNGDFIRAFDIKSNPLGSSKIIGSEGDSFFINYIDKDGIPFVKKVKLTVSEN